jgi:transcriptional regulator with XRE-family HTH domain
MNIGQHPTPKKLRLLRVMAELTQEKLGELSGLSQSKISNLEKGAARVSDLTQDEMGRLASTLGVGVADLSEVAS